MTLIHDSTSVISRTDLLAVDGDTPYWVLLGIVGFLLLIGLVGVILVFTRKD